MSERGFGNPQESVAFASTAVQSSLSGMAAENSANPEPSLMTGGPLHSVPLSLADIVRGSWLICIQNYGKLLLVGLIPWAITALLIDYFVELWYYLMPMPDSPASGVVILFVPPAMVWGAVLPFSFAQASLVHATSRILTNQRIRVGRALLFGLFSTKTVAPTSFALVFCSFIVALGLWVASVNLSPVLEEFLKGTALPWMKWPILAVLNGSVPGFLLVRAALFNQVAAIEKLDSLIALARSWRLLSGSSDSEAWPRRYDVGMFFIILAWLLTSLGAFWGVRKLSHFLIAVSSGSDLGSFLGSWSGPPAFMAGLIASVFGSVATTVFYYSIRLRKEAVEPSKIFEMTEPSDGNQRPAPS